MISKVVLIGMEANEVAIPASGSRGRFGLCVEDASALLVVARLRR